MKSWRFLLTGGLALLMFSPASATLNKTSLNQVNQRLVGQIVDHTANHGVDRRIWSTALGKKRDLYVYLPPGFNPHQKYPVMLWLHGLTGDERQFLEAGIFPIDQAMACGKMPPAIIAIPDGQNLGRAGPLATHTVFLNTRLGNYEDYLMCDVWKFVLENYPIRPEREAHILGGVSMGGGAAFHHAIKHRNQFGIVLGIFPAVNVRWLDCHGRYFADFDPNCWGWRNNVFWGHQPMGKFYGIIKVPLRRLVYPLYGRGQQAVARLSQDNPIEMLDFHQVQPGELSMFIGYGGKDEFNIDAQVESFMFRAGQRNLQVTCCYDPNGRHNLDTAKKFIQPAITWLAPQIAPYSPAMIIEQK